MKLEKNRGWNVKDLEQHTEEVSLFVFFPLSSVGKTEIFW